jgi:hypothetical protein
MKVAVLLPLAFLLQINTPDGPAVAPNSQFPLHVEVLVTQASADRSGSRGFGRGNILGPPEKGIDFTYECSEAILNTNKNEFYQARWKKQDRRLELLMQRIGSDHLDKCDIDIAYKAQPYKSR